eukprot:TRINITY_DN1442_c0_g1_i1.p1 TRINITY_DN1442_c0_g1~~TRINITY_DN1442_c0_g1_i1.p1  ORF type:complete len:1311 (+),score=348.63 TRINITY_DN1442_c0_g1_i1:56-3988(+)
MGQKHSSPETDKATKPKGSPKVAKVASSTERYLTFVLTDKPIYRTGDKVYGAAIALNSFTFKPCPETFYTAVNVVGPSGDVLYSDSLEYIDSVASFQWEIPKEQPGGDYTVKFFDARKSGVAPCERKFNIRAFRAPRMNNQIEFVRKGYTAGENVSAVLQSKRAEGGVPAGATVQITAMVDGQRIFRKEDKLSPEGILSVSFDLPASFSRGEGTLSFAIHDGGSVENARKTIPILLNTLDCNVFAEGGQLVHGLPGRIYVEAVTPYGDPADFTGEVVSDKDLSVAIVSTVHEGRGVSTAFAPLHGAKYRIRVLQPKGIHDIELPESLFVAKGATITASKAVFNASEPVVVQIGSTFAGKVMLFQREKALDTQTVLAGVHSVSLCANAAVSGVCRVVVYNSEEEVQAERLVFIRPAHPLQVVVTADKASYAPGDDVKLTINTQVSGQAVPAVVHVTVTDESVRQMLEKRKFPPRLPEIVYLETEVQKLEDAAAYLTDSPDGDAAIDALLGVQWWRLFAERDISAFKQQYGDAAWRALGDGVEYQPPLPVPMFFGGVPENAMLHDDFGACAEFECEDGGDDENDDDASSDNSGGEAAAKGAVFDQLDPSVGAAECVAPEVPAFIGGDEPCAAASVIAVDRMFMDEEQLDRPARMLMKRDMRMDDIMFAAPPPPPKRVYVRRFVHTRASDFKLGVRKDFAETVLWEAAVKTDAHGVAHVSFALSDSITSFQVFADGFSSASTGEQGSLGYGELLLPCVTPFYTEPKLPLEMTTGDNVELPIGINNGTSESLSAHIALTSTHPSVKLADAAAAVTVAPNERSRCYIPLSIAEGRGQALFTVAASATSQSTNSRLSDTVTRSSDIVSIGFPVQEAFAGSIQASSSVSHQLTLPATILKGSMVATAKVNPTCAGQLLAAMEGLIREPSGCFEQTSSNMYPMIMALQYYAANGGAPPTLLKSIQEKLDRGYKRLTGYECKDQGYEWFGDSPAHEALTAYGLMEFKDLSRVFEVDADMVNRTRQWLDKRRDGKGGFLRKDQALDDFGAAPLDVTNAYIIWALTEAGSTAEDLKLELTSMRALAATVKDCYILGLIALSHFNVKDDKTGTDLLQLILKSQQADGHIEDVNTTITCSGGISRNVEATALFILAAIRKPVGIRHHLTSASNWLYKQCQGGCFGSTQSTVMALKALVAFEIFSATPKAEGELILKVNGQMISQVHVDETKQGQIPLPGLDKILLEAAPGSTHKIELEMQNGSDMTYAIDIAYCTPQPSNSDKCPLRIETSITGTEFSEGMSKYQFCCGAVYRIDRVNLLCHR